MDRRRFLSAGIARHHDNDLLVEGSVAVGPDALQHYNGVWGASQAAHLLRRCVVAPTVAEVAHGVDVGMDRLLDELLAVQPEIPPPPRFVGEWLAADAIAWDSGRVDIADTFYSELRRWWIALMVNNGISLRERMTLFWHNHFATQWPVITDARYIYHQNQLFRQHALGSLRTLLAGVTVDKAMLIFLDGRYSKAGYVNENYAREFLELFTLGVTDNEGAATYVQKDVVAAAHALTGWDWIGFGSQGTPASNLLTGHDTSTKELLGETIPGNIDGSYELSRLLDIVLARAGAGRYLIRKLYRFFVHTDAPITPVRAIAADVEENIIIPLEEEFRASGWDIALVLRRLLSSQHFYEQGLIGSVIRGPVDFMVTLLRATSTTPLTGGNAEFAFQNAALRSVRIGQELFNPPGVQGWGWHRTWISTSTLPGRGRDSDELLAGAEITITDRLNALFNGPIPRKGIWKIDVLEYARQFASFDTPKQLVADIAAHLLGYPATSLLLDRLEKTMTNDRSYEWAGLADEFRDAGLRAMLRVLMRSPGFHLM